MKLKGDTMGNVMLKTFGLQTDTAWIWYGAIYLAAIIYVLLGLAYIALEYKRYDAPENVSVARDKADDEEDAGDGYVKAPKTPTDVANATEDVAVRVAGSSLLSPSVVLAFQDLWYSVPSPTKGEPDLQLLKRINGYALPGTITALMGSSGAGKTTLMDVIAGRKTGGKIEGQILLNGYPATDLAVRRATGYCEQMDIHSEAATFREALQFSAMLRQSDDIPAAETMAFAEECLELLDMKNFGDMVIRGASVEQMKRLTIGVELAAAPSVLFLDEPTSGLDARSAKIIMTGIRKIASTSRTVVCKIHQPSTEVFEMFDSLLLLKRGGETVFFGDLGTHAINMINYFTAIPNTPPLVEGANLATWMLEVIGAGVEAKSTNLPPNDYVQIFNDSHERGLLVAALERHAVPHPSLPELTFATLLPHVLAHAVVQLHARDALDHFGSSLGLVYRGVDYTTYVGATGGVGMVFLTSLFMGIISFNSVLPLATEKRASFYSERASQTYSALWYLVGGTVVEIPYVFVTTFVFCVIFYPFVGFNESIGACLFYGLNVSSLVLMNVYFGQLMAYAMPRVEVAAIIGTLFNSFFFLFMGYNPPSSQIPTGYKWLHHVIPAKYSVALLVAETFAKCTDGTQFGRQIMPEEGVPPSLFVEFGTTRVTVRQYVETVYEMKFDDRWTNFFAGCLQG
ncbi:hypothetical protein SDRG_17300 [Saprolegnia diclina VS20]|uniref:ABC transporter domain-containing protein n=1 Tax=Saprolegnia diclina (strain VS20) TaxID=1156394 RepID=T0PHG8_SAPDV|nr:hypothetical protein SDRG_17300 [Saprolegnia diclina VS20]EQC24809.1 hypothetical protein SDRG_17300 [Saprolegnia diclina VS20]|eukprot:XP_008621762.1 hypothetical protein SDRG_17300 [Saprolegnia diclina VS20]